VAQVSRPEWHTARNVVLDDVVEEQIVHDTSNLVAQC
jgi:hypothetical protein